MPVLAPAEKQKVTITYDGGVYDVTEFLEDHPGGSDIIQQWAGEDITGILHDPASHKHSTFALDLLKKYRIDDTKSTEKENKEETKVGGKFIDLDKPLVQQMWNLKISKEDYLREVHLPRHLGRPARFFESDRLEIFTKTAWYVIPIFWGPMSFAVGYIGCQGLASDCSTIPTASLWLLGLFSWSLLEYGFHRFIFHADKYLPNHSAAFTVHFLFHGVHHFLPMDHLRLVMPPLMFSFFCVIVLSIFSLLIPFYPLLVSFSGALVGYIGYDMMHYFFHHGTPAFGHIQEMKTYHMDHHYVNENLGFGVTTKIWDRVFGTLLPPNKKL